MKAELNQFIVSSHLLRAVFLLSIVLQFASNKVCANTLNFETSWVGNSFRGGNHGSVGQGKWIPYDNRDMHVTADGTMYLTVPWEEGGATLSQINTNGEVVDYANGAFGWGYSGGNAVTANNSFVYFGQRMTDEGAASKTGVPPSGYVWFGIDRRDRSNIDQGTAFSGGVGGGGGHPSHSFLVIHQVPNGVDAHISGLAATATELFVSCPYDNKIRVYNATTMAFLREWTVTTPGKLALDGQGNIWVVQASTNKVLRYSPTGTKLPQEIIFPAGSIPNKPVYVASTNSLWVSDLGANEQIRIYSNLNGSVTFAGTFGIAGGIYSGTPGQVEPLKFFGVNGFGVDSSGNRYVVNVRSGVLLQKYDSNNQQIWSRAGLHFIDCLDVDPGVSGEISVFGKDERYEMDYSQPNGQQWTLKAITYNPHQFPNDPRSGASGSVGTWVRQLNGYRVVFGNVMNGDRLHVHRFSPSTHGEIAIPAASFNFSANTVWQDANGNGQSDAGETASFSDLSGDKRGVWVDTRGDVWQVAVTGGIRKFPLQSIAGGRPQWNIAGATVFARPAPFNQLRRLRYFPQNGGTMLLAGYTASQPAFSHTADWKALGRVIAKYENWDSSPQKMWEIALPIDTGSGIEGKPQSMTAAGNYVFVAYTCISHQLGINFGHIKVYRWDTGAYVGSIEPPASFQNIGWQDITESIQAVQRANGEYLIFMEDDATAKVLMFRWAPDGINETAVIVDNSDSSGVEIVGSWTTSTWTGGGAFHGPNYLHDGNTGKGTKSVTFRPTLAAGTYQVAFRYTSADTRASNVPIEVEYEDGTDYLSLDQRTGGGQWVDLGTYSFSSGTAGSVKISTNGTSGFVIVDAVRFTLMPPAPEVIEDSSDAD